MSRVLISPAAISFLPTLTWHVIALGYFVWLGAKSKSTWLFTGWLGGLTLIIAVNFMARVIYAPLGGYIYWIGGVASALLSLTFELQFAYHCSASPWPREAHAVLLIAAAVTGGFVLWMVAEVVLIPHQAAYSFARFLYGVIRLDTQDNFTSAVIFDLVHPMGHVWAVVVLLRKTFYFTPPDPGRPWRRLWHGLWRPGTKEARLARALTLFLLMASLTAAVEIMEAHYLLPSGSFALLYMVFVFAIVLVYVDNAPEPSKFASRVIGIALVTVLLTIGVVSPRLLALAYKTYEQMRQAELAHIATLLETGEDWTARVPPAVMYIAARPADGGLFSDEYRLLFSRDPAIQASALTRQDMAMKAGLEHDGFYAQISVLDQSPWLKPEHVSTSVDPSLESSFVFPLPIGMGPLSSAGMVSYRKLSDAPLGNSASTAMSMPDGASLKHIKRYFLGGQERSLLFGGQTLYEVGYSYLHHRQTLHRQALPLLYLVLGTTGLSLLFFPRVFRTSLVRPLANLLEGVKRIDAGDINVHVPVQVADEIGLVTAAFNRMARSLRTEIAERRRAEAEVQALNRNLEQQVADRTRELRALYEVSAIANETHDLQALLEKSLRSTLTALRGEAGAINLSASPDGTAPDGAALCQLASLRLAVSQGLTKEVFHQVTHVLTEAGLLTWVVEQREALLLTRTDPRIPQTLHQVCPLVLLLAPIQTSDRVLGVIYLGRSLAWPFNPEEIALLMTITDQIGVAVEGDRLRQRAQHARVLEERQRIARNLHDAVTQSLYGLVTLTEAGQAQLEHLQPTRDAWRSIGHTLTRIGQISRQVLKEMRLFLHQLRPPVLEEEGLVGALQMRLEAVEGRANVHTYFLADEALALSPPVEEALYGIAQEALNNVLRHANASSVTIRLRQDGRTVTLEIIDDGCGFDLAEVRRGGRGLSNMRERARQIAADFRVISLLGKGTRVVVVKVEEGDERA